jgi:hypothetical protein
VVATWLAADCGGQFCIAVAGWRGTSSGTTALARRAACRLLLGSGGTAWWFVFYRVELSCATVLTSQSNRLLFESSSRGVVRSCWPVVVLLLFVVVPDLNVVSSF